MPKKKKNRRPRKPEASHPPQRLRADRADRLLAEFRTWLRVHDRDPEDAWLMEPLIELKRDLLASPDPTVWTAADTRELLTSVVPRKVLLDEDDIERLVPTVAAYLAFLEATARWSPLSAPRESLPALLGELTRTVPHALRDPARRSMGGNILALAADQGVDPSDRAAVSAFIDRFNEMDDADRLAVTETGRLPGDRRGEAFGLPAGGSHLSLVPDLGAGLGADWDDDAWDEDWDEEEAEAAIAELWPAFLGTPADLGAMTRNPSSDDLLEHINASLLVRRADHLLGWLGPGRPLTATKALRQADTAEVLEVLGIAAAPRSMWEVPALAALWSGLVGAGFLDLTSRTARPARRIVPWAGPQDDMDRRIDAGLALTTTVLLSFLGGSDGDGEGAAHMPPITYLALLKAAEPAGVHLPPAQDLVDDYVAAMVRLDLQVLHDIGVVTADGDTFHFSPTLLPLLAGVAQEVTAGLADE